MPCRKYFNIILIFILLSTTVYCQVTVDGKSFKRYTRSHFQPKRGLFYMLYAAPVITVDPLGLSEGKSTYGLSLGARFNVWESRMPDSKFSAFKIKGFYVGGGYEIYPQQYDKLYGSLWMRIKTILPLTARLDAIYASGYGLTGYSTRYAFGFEIKKITILFAGEYHLLSTGFLDFHPFTESPYANQGNISVVIPIYTRNSIRQ